MEREQHMNHAGDKVKLMCSYGGKIRPRPHDQQLTYAGGDTKILTVDRNIKFPNIVAKVNTLMNLNAQFRLKYQLPGEDLDSLVSLIDDDDVENMMFEYDRIHRISTKPARLRLFLFPLNQCATPGALLNPDFLFGFDKEYDPNSSPNFVIPQFPDAGNVGSDPKNRADGRVETEIHGTTDAQLRDGKVTSGASNAYTTTAPPIYWVPATAGAHRVGFGQYLERHVYNFLPVMTSTPDVMMLSSGVNVASDNRE